MQAVAHASTEPASLLEVAGAAVLVFLAIRVLLSCLEPVRAFACSRHLELGWRGQWAVVTGASAGVGRAYAEQLAALDMDIVLIGCFPVELQEVATAIEATYRVKTRIIVADFTEGCQLYRNIEQQLAGLDIHVLINNVGIYYRFPERFHLVPGSSCLPIEDKHSGMINCNTLSGTAMTNLIIPHMLAKKKGIIVDISSHTGSNFLPLYAVYSATKSYVATFTRALQQEYASQGVIIQHVFPVMVATKSTGIQQPSFMAPAADTFVRSALGSVGILGDTSGCFAHWLLLFFISMLPVWLRKSIFLKSMDKYQAKVHAR